MTKKLKPKLTKKEEPQQNSIQQQGQSMTMMMMTEQQEKMYYANKKTSQQNSHQKHQHQHLSHIKKKHTTTKNISSRSNNYKTLNNSEQQQYSYQEDITFIPTNIQLSNLTHTSAQQITQFINKLITKNKVTSRNAFDIPLIHLQQMEDFRSSLNENTWKRLSSTLENDYKIYGYRVDAAHNITYKMVESIARHQATAGEEVMKNRGGTYISYLGLQNVNSNKTLSATGNNNDPLTSQFMTSFNTNNQNISKNKLNVDYTKFIQKNQKLINVSHIQAFFGCNPGLEKTKRKFDQQGLKALLLDNIQLRNGCQLKLDQHHRRGEDQKMGNKIKKEAGNCINQIELQQCQEENIFQFNEMLKQIFNPSQPYSTNNIELENQPQNSVFDQINQLKNGQFKLNQDEYKRFQKLYKIISGEEREDKRRQLLKKKALEISDKMNQINGDGQGQGNVINNDVDMHNINIENMENIDQQIQDNNNNIIMQQQQNQLKDNDNNNESVNKPQTIPNQSQINMLLQPIQQQNNQQQHKNHPQIRQPLLQLDPNHQQNHSLLLDKNFQIHQLPLQRMQQSQSLSHREQEQKQILNIYTTGKYKNIEEYIKIKEQKVNQQNKKKQKILIDDMTTEEISKKLFNKKYHKKRRNQSIKQQNLIKDNVSNLNDRKKVDFTKLSKQSFVNNDLKRSVILKKSVTQERTFNQIKQKIKKRLQQRQKSKQNQQNENLQKRKKSKKTIKLFDLPTYQFEEGDTNFIQLHEQINPQTNQLEFSSFYKNHFPCFVKSSYKVIQDLKRQRQQKQKEKQQIARLKEIQQKQKQKMQQNNNLQQEQNGDYDPNNQANNQNQQQRPKDEQNEDQQLDISFIGDQIGQQRGGNHQIAIRDAKQKVKRIILQLFYNLKSRRNKSKKQKKISFKQIFQAYYKKQGFISPALCFLTILHLANQHNLTLEGKQDGTDFKIFVEEDNEIAQNKKKNDFAMEIQPNMQEFYVMNQSTAQSMSSATKEDKTLQQDLILLE